jgi:hypothetical protein
MSDDKITLPLGDMTVCAAGLDNGPRSNQGEAYARVDGTARGVRGTRADLLEILYYVESCPAFFADGQDKLEVSAVRRTSRSWRKRLGLGEREEVPVPASALR